MNRQDSQQGQPWLSQPTNQIEADLGAALEDARDRLPDEVTLRRLWSKVSIPELEQPTRSRWPWFAGGVVTSSALAVVLGVWLFPMHHYIPRLILGADSTADSAASGAPAAVLPTGATTTAKGTSASATLDDAEAMPPAAPVPSIVAPATVKTVSGQTRRFVLRGGTVARLSPSSVMSVAAQVGGQAGGNDRPAVEKGDVAFSVPHQAPGQTFWVTAGPYRVVVVGTKFRLHVEGSNVAVAVDEGVVEVWKHHRLARLTPGDSWASPSERGGVSTGVSGSAPAASTAPQPSAPAPAAAVAAPALAPAAPAAAPAVAVVVDPMQEARAALAAGEPYRALDAYRAAILRGGPAAENAEYEIGRVLRDRIGQPSDAISAWKRYRALHPDGLLRVETDVSIIETLVSSGDSTGALSEANDFLRHHAISERRAEIARIAGDLYRERGDCRRAIDVYQTALTASRTREVTEYASFHRAACLVRVGDDSGNVALQEYLHAWPSGRFSGDANRLLQAMNDRAKTP